MQAKMNEDWFRFKELKGRRDTLYYSLIFTKFYVFVFADFSHTYSQQLRPQ